MKKTLILLLLFCGITVHAANPSYNNFDTNFFKIINYLITWNTNAGSGASNYIASITRSNASISTFNPNQFSAGPGGTNIIFGVPITNIHAFGGPIGAPIAAIQIFDAINTNKFEVWTGFGGTLETWISANGQINTVAAAAIGTDAFITRHLFAGTNVVGETYGTNYHSLSLPGNSVAWSIVGDTGTGSNYVNVPMFTQSQTNSANIQSATLNTTGNGSIGGNLSVPNGDVTISSGGVFNFGAAGSGRTRMTSLSDGTLELVNTAANGFTRVQLGGSSAAFPSIARVNGNIEISDGPGTGTTNNFIVPGYVAATNGFRSVARNLATPLAITVGSSPLLLTNSSATALGGTNNVFVFIDGAGVTGTVGINGTTVYSALAGADATIPLQPGEYVTVTWSVGTPVVKAKPF